MLKEKIKVSEIDKTLVKIQTDYLNVKNGNEQGGKHYYNTKNWRLKEEAYRKTILFNILANLTNDKIEEKAHNQMNPQGEQSVQIKIANRFPESNGYTHVVLQTNKKIAEKVIQIGR